MLTAHLVVVTSDRTKVAVMSGPSGWTLPSVERTDRLSRVDFVRLLVATLGQIGPTRIVHWAPLSVRTAGSGIDDLYCLAVVEADALDRSFGAVVVDRDRLSEDFALPPSQRLALRTALSRLDTPTAIFDAHEEIVAAEDWATRRFAEATGLPMASVKVARYYCGRHHQIFQLVSESSSAYLKSGVDCYADEGVLTQRLWRVRPDQFPETLAEDRRHHRWLYRTLNGTTLASLALTPELIAEAVRALASLQVATMGMTDIADHVAARRRTVVELFDVVDAIVHEGWRHTTSTYADATLAGWQSMRADIRERCADIDALAVPSALVLSDFWSENILRTPAGIGFIDLGNSYWGFPVLPLWRFARDVERRVSSLSGVRTSIRRTMVETFVAEWSIMVPPRTIVHAVSQLWLVGRLFSILMASCDLDHHERELGTDLPVGYRAMRLAGRFRDLLHAHARRRLLPRVAELDAAAALDLR